MRRMWGRPCEPCRGCCRCGPPGPPRGRETRSLDGSRSELRPASPASPAGWATPKRQRLDSARDSRAGDDMLRAAMRNSYDRAEESRQDRNARPDFSDCCTYRSHRLETSSYMETATEGFTDSECSKMMPFASYSDYRESDTATVEVGSPVGRAIGATGTSSPFDSSDTYSASFPTAHERAGGARRPGEQISRSAHIEGRISERSVSVENDDTNLLPYDKPLTIETPSYEVLEIVVSESLETRATPPGPPPPPGRPSARHALGALPASHKSVQNINIDEYVSNILVESLNSLTDQLECMNASIGSDKKISIVEKEIKVKLQNTGVNTIVHLSPTSNNQIIFGNEELCHKDGRRDASPAARDEPPPAQRCPCDAFDLQHDNVNQAVLQQIQKLFRDELHNFDPNVAYPSKVIPEISHIEISNVDVFIDNSGRALEPGDAERAALIGGVGAGNYFPSEDDNPVVPRFSAFPHTESMEVNTSSSDDAELVASDCTSLVDSLDDPNSPRSVLLRRSFNNRRTELVRSAIDVLDLLPENVRLEESQPKDKGESFFIRIKDNECGCDKENVNVADHMPEKIKQRLYRRHRKRELRMECARRSRGKLARREAERLRRDEAAQARRRAEAECAAIVAALVDDVIARVAQDEYRCMRIQRRLARPLRLDDDAAKRNWKKELDPIEAKHALNNSKNGSVRFESNEPQSERPRGDRHQIRGKLSLLTRPSRAPDDKGPKRIYQKSEIHEGNKCIEILEILEYVNGSQSSPETATSDENQNYNSKNKKSRIPVPVHERRSPVDSGPRARSRRASPPRVRDHNANRLLADMLLGALADAAPPPAPRERSNSLLFKRTFDIIPEERSSLSLESGNEDMNQNRRASAPGGVAELRLPGAAADTSDTSGPRGPNASPKKCRDTKSASTSPINDAEAGRRVLRSKNQTTMTSPSSKSAATSPLRRVARPRAWVGCARGDTRAPLDEGCKSRPVDVERRSVTSRPERAGDTRRAARPDRAERCERAERVERAERSERVRRRGTRPPRGPEPARTRAVPAAVPRANSYESTEKQDSQSISQERSEEDTVVSERPLGHKGGGEGSSSDSSESGGSLLCSLAPKWLSQARARRDARRRPPAPPPPLHHAPGAGAGTGGWSVTVAGSCRAALPADVEMRLRFPHERERPAAARGPCQECSCSCACATEARTECARAAPPLPPAASRADTGKLTLTMKKEALDSSILASKSTKKSSEPLPDVETYRASRSKVKSSVKAVVSDASGVLPALLAARKRARTDQAA